MKKELIKQIEKEIKENDAAAQKSDSGLHVVKLVNRNIGLKKAIEIISQFSE